MNAGQFLASLSGLSGVTAAQHLAAIKTGETRIAYRSNVQMATPTLRATSREKRRDSFQTLEPTTLRAKPNSKKYVYAKTSVPRLDVLTDPNDVFVRTITESTEI